MEWLIWVAVVLVGVAVAYAVLDRVTSRPQQAVLPAHYDPTNYATDPSSVPGWCVHCGTRNDPDYRYCGNCTAELPDTDPVSTTGHWTFGEE